MRRKKLSHPTALHQRFWEVERVQANDALLDKCDVVIGGWTFDANRHAVSELVPRLSRLEVPCGFGKTTRLFEDRTAQDGRYSHTLKVRGTGSGEGTNFPHPTFSGFLKLREVRTDESNSVGTKTWEGLFFAYLNLNRSLQAQVLRREAFDAEGSWTFAHPYALAISESAAAKVRERLLAPSSNILDRSRKRTEYVQSRSVEHHFRNYVGAIFRQLRYALPMKQAVAASRPQPTITFEALEVCWDFFDTQPILTVWVVKNQIQRITQHLKVRYFPQFKLEEGLDYDSPSVMVHVVDGIAIRFYAKTQTTVQFEVVYTQSGIKNSTSVSGIQSISGALSAIASLKEDAAARLNVVFEILNGIDCAGGGDATVEELIEAVMSAADGTVNGTALLTRLAHYHRIAPFPSDPMYPQLRSLKRLGVLKNETWSPRRRTYVVTTRFRRARDQLLASYVVPLARKPSLERKKRRRGSAE